MTSKKVKKREFIVYLKAIACFLITNSHCRDIYPWFFLAIGGGHGNAIFFAVSGFCLANIKDDFFTWIKKRIVRVIKPLFFMIILSCFFIEGIDDITQMSFLQIVIFYINKYWFVAAIILYYPMYYLIFYKNNLKTASIFYIFYTVLYFTIYCFSDKSFFFVELEGFALFKVVFYFKVFMIGGLLRL